MHVKIKLSKKMNVHSGRAKNGKFVKLTHFKKIGLNQWNQLDQHKESMLLNLAIVPPPQKKNLAFFRSIYLLSVIEY